MKNIRGYFKEIEYLNKVLYTICMGINEQKQKLNQELDNFNFLLSKILPRYLELIKKENKTPKENKELIDTENTLLDINTKITNIKLKLDQDLLGEIINLYYRVKAKAKEGDINSKIHLDKLKKRIKTSIEKNHFFNWN